MFRKIVACGIFAGFAVGLIAAVLQIAFVIPVLLEAERYESGEMVHFGGAAEVSAHVSDAEHDHSSHEHAAGTDDGDEEAEGSLVLRHAKTVLATIATYAGYGLILVAGFALAGQRGYRPDGRTGLIWGLCGFVAVQLAPAAGLPPELPGSSAGELFARQVWWLSTILLTATGLWIIAFAKHWVPWVLGAVLILVPHLIGAPHPEELQGVVPPELAGLFAGRSLAVGLASWVCLGGLAGRLWNRETLTG